MLPSAGRCHPTSACPARLCSILQGWAGHGQARGARLSPHPCCQHSTGPAAKQGTARAPPGTGIEVWPPQTAADPSLLPAGAPGTQEALGCCMGARPARGSAHIPPGGKRRAGAGGRLSERGLGRVAPRLQPHPACTLSLGTLTSVAPAAPSPGCPGVPGQGIQPAAAPTLAASTPAAVLASVLVAPTSRLAPEPWRGAGGGQVGSSLSAGTWVMVMLEHYSLVRIQGKLPLEDQRNAVTQHW